MSRLCCCIQNKNKKIILIRNSSNIEKIIKKDLVDYNVFKTLREECIICLNDLEKNQSATLLKCGHVYHTDCIHNWFQKKQVLKIFFFHF